MRKFIVKIEDDVTDEQAAELLLAVIKRGKISEGANGQKHYCWMTVIHNFVVSVFPKYWNNNETFHISKQINV